MMKEISNYCARQCGIARESNVGWVLVPGLLQVEQYRQRGV